MNIPLINFSDLPKDVQEYITDIPYFDWIGWLIPLTDNQADSLNLCLFNPFPNEIEDADRSCVEKLLNFCHEKYGLKPFYLIKT